MKKVFVLFVVLILFASCNLGAFYSEEFFKEKYHTSTTTTSSTTTTVSE